MQAPTPAESLLSGLAHTIQLALGPVFLLTGIAAFLNVLTNRLARIIDRMRTLEARPTPESAERAAAVDAELRVLRVRMHIINRAIGLCTAAALLVAGVVAALFVGEVLRLDLSILVAIAFVAAMGALIGGLLSFLREIHEATRYMRRVAPPG